VAGDQIAGAVATDVDPVEGVLAAASRYFVDRAALGQ